MKKLLEMIKKLFGSKSSDSSEKGFTLIELLVVIAVLGVLAAAVLVAINPLEQLARGRDGGRKQGIASVGRAIQNYYTINFKYPIADNSWITTLINSGEIKIAPVGYSAPSCTAGAGQTAGVQSAICYITNGTNFIIFTHMESSVERNKYGGTATTSTCANTLANTWYVYASNYGKAATLCSTAEPTIGTYPTTDWPL